MGREGVLVVCVPASNQEVKNKGEVARALSFKTMQSSHHPNQLSSEIFLIRQFFMALISPNQEKNLARILAFDPELSISSLAKVHQLIGQ